MSSLGPPTQFAETFSAKWGYREVLFHQGEEGDLCIRLLQQGWVVRLGASAPILHYRSRLRSQERINIFSQRNLILFAWHNIPMPEFFPHLVMTVFNGLRWGLRHDTFGFRLRGTGCGVLEIAREFSRRAPISHGTYWLYRRLKKRGPMRFLDAEDVLRYRQ